MAKKGCGCRTRNTGRKVVRVKGYTRTKPRTCK